MGITFQHIDENLFVVEVALRMFTKTSSVLNPTIERWRSGHPLVSLQWVQRDGISRNINGFTDTENATDLIVEVNAWKDEDHSKRVRRWKYEKIELLKIPLDKMKLEKALKTGFEKVCQWKKEDLQEYELSNKRV